MVVLMDYQAHQLLHRQAPPTPPGVEDMQKAIDRHNNKECGCYERDVLYGVS